MAISVNWATKVIYIPKADMALVQSAPPIEIRELDLNTLRLTLKDLEDSEEGICSLDTHTHNTSVTLAGVVYAHMLIFTNGYTVTFEDGQYAVNAVGANSNLLDVLNPNQVSLRCSNAAGLIVYTETEGDLPAEIGELIFDGQDIETGLTFRQCQRLLAAALAALVSGATDSEGDEWITILNAVANNKTRIRALVDQYGNRKQIQYTLD